jgi:ubiquinone/menaquinone biosynthesis C-methylase UbiE
VGIDLNTGILEVARANTPISNILIAWQEGDVCALPFPDDSFDDEM